MAGPLGLDDIDLRGLTPEDTRNLLMGVADISKMRASEALQQAELGMRKSEIQRQREHDAIQERHYQAQERLTQIEEALRNKQLDNNERHQLEIERNGLRMSMAALQRIGIESANAANQSRRLDALEYGQTHLMPAQVQKRLGELEKIINSGEYGENERNAAMQEYNSLSPTHQFVVDKPYVESKWGGFPLIGQPGQATTYKLVPKGGTTEGSATPTDLQNAAMEELKRRGLK